MVYLPPLPELCFAEIPATSRHRYVGDRFCYMEAGCADLPTVLLLHGIGANSLHWRYQLAGLADRFRLIAWNAPGYLLSDNLRVETPSCGDYADALNDLLATLGIGGFDIVANSFGTRVAHCFAYHRPGRIGRIVFTGTSIPHGTPPAERARTVEMQARMIEGGAIRHQRGRRNDAVVVRFEDRPIHALRESQIIGIDDQSPHAEQCSRTLIDQAEPRGRSSRSRGLLSPAATTTAGIANAG